MSYILDALKKSEQERARGTVPDIKAIHEQKPVAPPKRYHWHIIVAVILLLNAGGVGYWVYQKNSAAGILQSLTSPTSKDDNNTPAQTDVSGTSASASANQQAGVAQALEEKFVEAQGSDAAEKMMLSKAETKPSIGSNKPAKAKKEDNNETSKPNVVFSDKPLTVSENELENAEKVGTVANLSDVQIIVEAENEREKVDSQIYNISDLPESIKSALPAISFAGHVYSSSAEQSSVMLNGRKMRESQEVSKDLILEQITIEGVVFRYQDYRFKLGALQDWSFQ